MSRRLRRWPTIATALGGSSLFCCMASRVGQDGCLSGGHAARARSRPVVDPAGSGDRPDAADRWPARPGLRTKGGAAPLRAHAGRAQRAVAADQAGRSADCGRHALGHLCACAQPGTDFGGRGARPELQAGRDAALQRPRCGCDARQARWRGGGAGVGNAFA